MRTAPMPIMAQHRPVRQGHFDLLIQTAPARGSFRSPWETAVVIPLPVILCEFMVAFGLALFGANSMALVKLRREGNWPPAEVRGGPAPSRGRILGGITVGLLVALWAIATFVTNDYSL